MEFASPDHLLRATTDAVLQSVKKFIVPCPFYDFSIWALTPGHAGHEVYLQLSAINQLARLTGGLLGKIGHDEISRRRLVAASQTMNAWQVHEVVSDNLAIDLGHPPELDSDRQTKQRDALVYFNEVLVGRLRGSIGRFEYAFDDLPWSEISLISLCHSSSAYGDLIDLFCENRNVTASDVMAGAHHQMDANIETCVAMLDAVPNLEVRERMEESLIGRYSGLNELLSTSKLEPQRLIEIGADTILVLPTLAYYIAIIADLRGFSDALSRLADEGMLDAMLRPAALAVRLLNDVGTALLEMSPDNLQKIITWMSTGSAPADRTTNLFQFLNSVVETNTLFNRLRKDIQLNELNILLHGLAYTEPVQRALPLFAKRLRFVSDQYRQSMGAIARAAAMICDRIGDPTPVQLVRHFVDFHRRLYLNAYDNRIGEYAIC